MIFIPFRPRQPGDPPPPPFSRVALYALAFLAGVLVIGAVYFAAFYYAQKV